jgi:hypothetical protein
MDAGGQGAAPVGAAVELGRKAGPSAFAVGAIQSILWREASRAAGGRPCL